MRVRIHNALPAGAAVLLLALAGFAGCAARAQTPDLRGTSTPDQPPSDTDTLRAAPGDGTEPLSEDLQPPFPEAVPPPAPVPPPPLAQVPAGPLQQPQLGAAPEPGGMINYGKPKPKQPKLYKLYKPNPKVSPPLPPLVPYKTSPQARQKLPPPPLRGELPDPDAPIVSPAPNYAVLPAPPPPRRLRPDLDPFAPLGIDVGSLRLFPFVELGAGYDTNPNRLSSSVVGSPWLRASAGVKVQSEWSQHSLTADLRGGYSDYPLFHSADRPDAAGTVSGRIDVLRDTQITSDLRFSLSTQQPGSPQIAIPGNVFIINRPLIMTYGETLGVTQNFSRLQVTLRGSFDRYTYGDALQSDGTILLLSTEDYNDYGLQTRIGYEITPGVIPFLQVGGDLRRHDDYLDFAGFARDFDGVAAKAGSKFEFSRLFTGELAVGYATRKYADPRLPILAAPTIDGSIVYTATPLTTITLRTSTDFAETTDPFASGAVSHTVSLQVAHALFRDLLLKATGTFQNYKFVGETVNENLYSLALGADYSLTRDIMLRATYTHERFLTNLSGSNYVDDAVLLSVRLQR